MKNKTTYWEVHLIDAELSQAGECEAEGDGYYLKAVRMTQEEIKNLLEFMGW